MKPQLNKQQEWLALSMILSGETNIRERKQIRIYKADICTRSKSRNKKSDKCWKQLRKIVGRTKIEIEANKSEKSLQLSLSSYLLNWKFYLIIDIINSNIPLFWFQLINKSR